MDSKLFLINKRKEKLKADGEHIVNRDDFISRFKMTNWGREEVLRQVAQG
jgi:hypothetical protein